MRLAVARGPRGQPICIQTLSRAPLNWSLSAKAPLAPRLSGRWLLTESWDGTAMLPRVTPSTKIANVVPARYYIEVTRDAFVRGGGWPAVWHAPVALALLGAAASGPAGGRYEKGLEDYQLLVKRCPPTGTVGGTAIARCGSQWWSYDTPETIKTKMTYARGRALGGAFAWELSGDTPDGALLNAVAAGLSPTS